MIEKLFNIFFSIEFVIIMLLIFMVAQIYATLGFASDKYAWIYVYGTHWFEAVMWLLGINILGIMIKFKTYRRYPAFILHVSVIVILIGAAVTRYAGYSGVLHLRVGQTSSMIPCRIEQSNIACNLKI